VVLDPFCGCATTCVSAQNHLNIKPNALFTEDNLYVLNGMNSDCIDLIYLDPPFNSNRIFSAPVGSKGAVAAFKDMWKWDDVDSAYLVRLTEQHPQLVDYITSIEKSHSRAMMAYIAYMAQRLFEMHRVLKDTGSIYLHCDPTASHYLKIVMDFIFGRKNFRNEVVWCYKASNSPIERSFPRKHDNILFYSKNEEVTFYPQYTEYNPEYIEKTYRHIDNDGRRYRTHSKRADGSERRLYLDEGKGTPVLSWWTDIKGFGTVTRSKEITGYPTQKPLALLDRIILASSNEGDVVLDPFCGCATTCVSAQNHHRKWIGIDLSAKTEELIKDRLKKDGVLFNKFSHFTTLPDRRDVKRMSKRAARPILYGKQRGNCAGCKEHFQDRNLEVDHIIPKSKGGGDFLENYQFLCGSCNRIKGDRPMEYLIRVLESRRAQRLVFGEKLSTLRNI